MLLGAIADDLTGASDIALAFSREGLRTIQMNGVPDNDADVPDVDAVVIALKSRTIAAHDAVAQTRQAASWLTARGARQLIFKYCSTFDSTDTGNIGPVTEALLEQLDEHITIACPTFPENGRVVFQGHLFVGQQLLSESAMKDHPLTPMHDANLVRVLQRQTELTVGLLAFEDVRKGPTAISTRIEEGVRRGTHILIADAASAGDLEAIAIACRERRLITGAAGIGGAIARNYHMAIAEPNVIRTVEWPRGRSVILAGSCSVTTRRQVAHAIEIGYPARKIDPIEIAAGRLSVDGIVAWVLNLNEQVPLLYSGSDPDDVSKSQHALGPEAAGSIVEAFLGAVAVSLRSSGFRRIIVAGGETSGAVAKALGIGALEIGPEIDPGVPWTKTIGAGENMAMAFKSGNFGTNDFFEKAWKILP